MSSILLKAVIFKGKTADILISGKRIEKIAFRDECGTPQRGFAADRVLNCAGKHILPGFVNMHTHAAMTLVRGCFEDMVLNDWLRNVWAVEDHLTEDDIYWGTKLAILEMIKTGTTCYHDMYWFPDVARRAAEEMGIRAMVDYCMLDGQNAEKGAQLRKVCLKVFELSRQWSDLVTFALAVHGDYTNSEETLRWASDFASDNGLVLHAHICETSSETKKDIYDYGMTPVERFDKFGLLGPKTVLAHGVWLTDADIELLAKRGASVVHNVNSNLKLSSGYKFRYNELRDAGVNVCLGTDGAASSNNLDMREAAKTMALMQKAWREDPSAMPLGELMDVASLNGAKALGIDAGQIREGALADIMLVDTSSEAFVPDFNFTSNFIYSANSSCIDTVICDGRILMEKRRVPGEEEIISKTLEIAHNLYKRSGKWKNQ